MTSDEIRAKYLTFFKAQKHVEIAPSPLVLEADPTTLFTSSGMQQLVPYLMGEKHPAGKRLVDSQPLLRVHGKTTDDLEEIGDLRHLSYFEMLGNWSLGDYFKKEQLSWVWEFLAKELNLDSKRLWVTIFEGGDGVARDDESEKIWLSLGVSKDHIFAYPAKKNWWSRSGVPSEMPDGEIGGPDSEVFYEFPNVSHDSKYGELCHPNCDCGHFIEICNSVFMQYKKQMGKLVELPQKNVDFGGGLERLTQAVQDKPDAFTTDIYAGVVKKISEVSGYQFGTESKKDKHVRIVADHLRASVAIASYGIYPSNKLQGYVLRKLIRRALFHFHLLGGSIKGGDFVHLAESYKSLAGDDQWLEVEKTLSTEGVKFGEALERGLAYLRNAINRGVAIDGKFIFDLYQNYGFPGELALEILKENSIEVTSAIMADFKTQFEAHRALSQTTSAGVFKGGLAGSEEKIRRLHTATHLMQAGLRKVLGESVEQKGQHITADRSRFDFSFGRKLTEEEREAVEEYVNRVVSLSLPVTKTSLSFDEARQSGALGFFKEKYGEKVDVYTVASDDLVYSREMCGGPHVENTNQIGRFTISKQEKAGAGVVRVYATVE